jgi:RNA polymerase sigma factor (sigma-70 family)
MIFEEEKSKKENIQIMNSVLSGFRKSIYKEDIQYLKDYSLWESIRRYSPDKNTKFSSYLYKVTRWKCLEYIELRKPKFEEYLHIDSQNHKYKTNYRYINLILDLTKESKDLLIDRYIGRLTIKEMGDKYKSPQETIRLKLLKIIEKIKTEK